MKIKDITTKGWLIIGITILIVVLLVMYIRSTNKTTKTTTTTTTPVKPGNITPAPVFPLKQGSRNKEVGIVQQFLNGKGEKLVVDNIWGPKTDAAALRVLGINSIDSDYFYNEILPFY